MLDVSKVEITRLNDEFYVEYEKRKKSKETPWCKRKLR